MECCGVLLCVTKWGGVFAERCRVFLSVGCGFLELPSVAECCVVLRSVAECCGVILSVAECFLVYPIVS